jgi:hypothetical protein
MMTAPELLKQEMPLYRQCEANVRAFGYEPGTQEFREALAIEIRFYRQFAGEVR